MTDEIDRRPPPRPRKLETLWQAYLYWDEFMQMRKRHTLRLSSIDRDKSKMDDGFERDILENIEPFIGLAEKGLAAQGKTAGPIWDWLTGIKGIGDHTAAKLLAQFDDPSRYETVSKFWTFAGLGLYDGKIQVCTKGEKSSYNRRLKSECYLVAENFVRQQTTVYVDIYYEEKEYQRRQHPAPLCRKCGAEAAQKSLSWYCPKCGARAADRHIAYTPAHLDARAKRKMVKIFLSHLWVKWREYEGLPVSLPWVFRPGGHDLAHYMPPGEAAAE